MRRRTESKQFSTSSARFCLIEVGGQRGEKNADAECRESPERPRPPSRPPATTPHGTPAPPFPLTSLVRREAAFPFVTPRGVEDVDLFSSAIRYG